MARQSKPGKSAQLQNRLQPHESSGVFLLKQRRAFLAESSELCFLVIAKVAGTLCVGVHPGNQPAQAVLVELYAFVSASLGEQFPKPAVRSRAISGNGPVALESMFLEVAAPELQHAPSRPTRRLALNVHPRRRRDRRGVGSGVQERLSHVDQLARVVPDHVRAEDAVGDLVARLVLAIMDAGHDPVGLGQHVIGQVEPALFQNVAGSLTTAFASVVKTEGGRPSFRARSGSRSATFAISNGTPTRRSMSAPFLLRISTVPAPMLPSPRMPTLIAFVEPLIR